MRPLGDQNRVFVRLPLLAQGKATAFGNECCIRIGDARSTTAREQALALFRLDFLPDGSR